MVVPHFVGVENKNVAVPEWNEHPYSLTELQNICYVTPVKDIRNLSVTWSIPDLQPYYKTNVRKNNSLMKYYIKQSTVFTKLFDDYHYCSDGLH